jgi:hypothetical protein
MIQFVISWLPGMSRIVDAHSIIRPVLEWSGRAPAHQRLAQAEPTADRPAAGHACQRFADMVPCKRPRLTATKVQGDKDYPLFDLSALSDSELAFLRRTILKATPIDPG